MCENCWQLQGSPDIDNEKVRIAKKLIAQVYKHSCAGGGLHIVVDDFNIEKHSIQFCLDHIGQFGDYTPEQHDAEKKCAEHLLTMTDDEVMSAVEFWDRK